MKFLIGLVTLLAMNFAQADIGTVESYFSPAIEKDTNTTHLYLQNACYQEVFVATRSLNPNGVWESIGFTRLYPGQVLFQTNTKADVYYLHAFTADHRVYWEGKHKFELRDRELRALLVELPKEYNGNWTTVLYCR